MRSSHALWISSPILTCIVAVILTAVPLGFRDGIWVTPAFPLICFFYWSLHRPELLHPIAISLIGFFQDVLSGGPIMMWALVYLVLYSLIQGQRSLLAGRAMTTLLVVFVPVAFGALGLAWLLASMYYSSFISPAATFSQIITTIVLFIPICGILVQFDRRLSLIG